MKKINNPLFNKEKLAKSSQLFVMGGQTSNICSVATCDGCREDTRVTATDDNGNIVGSIEYLR